MVGETFPALLSPSVKRTTMRLFESFRSLSRFAQEAIAEPMAVPSSTRPELDALEIPQKPIVVQREGADEVGPPGEAEHADAIIRAAFDEFLRHIFHDIDAARAFTADGKILGDHGT